MDTFSLETPRLLLGPFASGDADALYAYLSDPEVVRFEPYDPFTREQAASEAVRRADDPEFIAVRLKESGRLIGNFYFSPREYDAFELGFVFARAWWGMGYATEGASALVGHAFSAMHAHRVYGECNPENTRSARLFERLGFRKEAHFVQNIFFHRDENGVPVWQDTLVYAVTQGANFGIS